MHTHARAPLHHHHRHHRRRRHLSANYAEATHCRRFTTKFSCTGLALFACSMYPQLVHLSIRSFRCLSSHGPHMLVHFGLQSATLPEETQGAGERSREESRHSTSAFHLVLRHQSFQSTAFSIDPRVHACPPARRQRCMLTRRCDGGRARSQSHHRPLPGPHRPVHERIYIW